MKENPTAISFEDLGLAPDLLPALTRQGYTQPYPIQTSAIPAVLKGRDVLGIAPTGSGKTAGFVLPILTLLQGQKPPRNRYIRSLIVVPTRELAGQVQEVLAQFSQELPERIKTMAVFGGVSINPQMKALSGTQVLVATPGRLLELVRSNALHLDDVQTLVLDEADKMLNLGFEEEMNEILALLPAKRQNLLFSATLSPGVDAINRVLLDNPEVVEVATVQPDMELINQYAYLMEPGEKGPFLRYLLKEREMKQVLIFTSSVYQADHVADKLKKNGFEAMAIHGKKSQGARTEALSRFKSGKTPILVATDLLSRGIDIQFLPFVINYELPRSPKDYVHRVGRTGRAENPGEAMSFITRESLHHFKIIQKKMKKRLELRKIENIDWQ